MTAGTRVGSATVVVTGGAAGVGSGTAAGVTPGESTGGAGAGAGAGVGFGFGAGGGVVTFGAFGALWTATAWGCTTGRKVGTARRTGARCVRTITAASWFAPPVFEEPVFEAPVFEITVRRDRLAPGHGGVPQHDLHRLQALERRNRLDAPAVRLLREAEGKLHSVVGGEQATGEHDHAPEKPEEQCPHCRLRPRKPHGFPRSDRLPL